MDGMLGLLWLQSADGQHDNLQNGMLHRWRCNIFALAFDLLEDQFRKTDSAYSASCALRRLLGQFRKLWCLVHGDRLVFHRSNFPF